ncbi:hypothetical protein AA106555_0121 [Neokomagataea thailandica NBRC 106555]|uniref:Hydrophobic W protein n=2 Tax=Neokomagataea TaxID=1223423 RepID=A0A4Y6V668_9PROT|nr:MULTISPECIES: hypothetical protein [Neokomagataea]QDH24864.1 hypothetical protein D5366_06130 [Neokomagataea tanensis]GBR50186.1 hypothetical protein AA106555_0121 [Neokomagataea thailandica NBRC 106555]
MTNSEETPVQNRVIDLRAGARLMVLDAGVFCIFHAPGQADPEPNGLPGVRISKAPATPAGLVSISTFDEDGWIGGSKGAALVRVLRGPAAILVTTYQDPANDAPAPQLQVVQLASPTPVAATAAAAEQATTSAKDLEISAHVQRRGDVGGVVGEWMGNPESQTWIEGFAIAPVKHIPAEDIEYQAVLGKGWLSPWAEGGQYCGSRGMALPILGLRVRLKNGSAETHEVRLTATFTDGTRLGPVDGTEALEAESLAPLEAFLLEIVPVQAPAKDEPAAKKPKATSRRKAAPAK